MEVSSVRHLYKLSSVFRCGVPLRSDEDAEDPYLLSVVYLAL